MREINKLIPFDYNQGQIPPQDTELEQVVLGALLIESSRLVELLPILKPEVFYKEAHIFICKAIINLSGKSIPVDMLTCVEELKSMGELENSGGAYYVASLTTRIASGINTHAHYRYLMEKYFRRELIKIGYILAQRSYDETVDVFETYEWVISEVEELDVQANMGTFVSINKAIEQLNNIANNDPNVIKTFYPIDDPGIDNILMISPGNLVNISGKSGGGKTTSVIYMAKSLLRKYKNKVAFCWYTMEDEASKIIAAMMAPDIRLTHQQIHGKNYTLSAEEKKSIANLTSHYSQFDIEFVESKSTSHNIKLHFQRFCSKRPDKFNICIIDNIMLLKDNEQFRWKGKGYEVDDHIANNIQSTFISTKANYDVNVWYLHHLTKEQLSKSNFNEGYRPKEDQIKGSTRLRDIATQGILIHRPGEFQDIVKHYKKSEYENAIKDLMISEVFKNRNGKTGFYRHFVDLDYKIFYPLI